MTFGGVNPNIYVGPINYYPILPEFRNLIEIGLYAYKINNKNKIIKSQSKANSLISLLSATLFSAHLFMVNGKSIFATLKFYSSKNKKYRLFCSNKNIMLFGVVSVWKVIIWSLL